ncbi:F-box/WD repeat-containing protein 7-like [Patiria miniata]|uniref:F-box domain-containing protein n=1 Tax=Patiria miniata TaxID=46514 RepID=A0A913YYP0_PATMI|nr:F-box/WD repeat-containing protein 7-like [Patiria miniata]
MDTLQSEEKLIGLPEELKAYIFGHLTATDLCHVALCNRILRESANQDALWRLLCRKNGWERYGTNLCKEPPFTPTLHDQLTGGEGGSPTFPVDAVVTGSDWPGLVDTCKWKEVYMKARHLEENWRNQRFYATTFKFGQTSDETGLFAVETLDQPKISNLDCEGGCLAVGVDDGTLQIWDVSIGKRRHNIRVNVSEEPDALKMKDGIIAAGCMDGKIRTYSAQTGEQLQVMSGHYLAVSRLFFDGDTIVSVARRLLDRSKNYADSGIRVCKAEDASTRFVLQYGCSKTSLIHLDYRTKVIAGAYSDNTIQIWDAENGSDIQHIICDMKKLVSCYLGDGIVIGASKDFAVKIWKLESWECLRTFRVPLHPESNNFELIGAAPYAFNGELLVAISRAHLTFMDLEGKLIGSIFNTHENHTGTFFTQDNSKFTTAHCFHGNKLITGSSNTYSGKYDLWIVNPAMGVYGSGEVVSKMDLGGEAFAEFTGAFSPAWMNDTKVVFEGIDKESGFGPQRPTIVIRHYW